MCARHVARAHRAPATSISSEIKVQLLQLEVGSISLLFPPKGSWRGDTVWKPLT